MDLLCKVIINFKKYIMTKW